MRMSPTTEAEAIRTVKTRSSTQRALLRRTERTASPTLRALSVASGLFLRSFYEPPLQVADDYSPHCLQAHRRRAHNSRALRMTSSFGLRHTPHPLSPSGL